MKKIYSILSMMLLLAAASCNREMVENAEPVPAAKDRVPIIMSFAEPVTLQAKTKADDGKEMGLLPSIKTIHVAVFGSSGYLKDYASAIPCDSEGNPLSGFVSSNATTGYFKVYLPFDEGPSRRRIHIIANGPSSLPFNAYEGDDAIIKALTVSDGNGAYWTRFETDPTEGEGIMIKTTDTGSGIVKDTDANGDYVPAAKTTEVFQGLKLIRNFAGITVIKSDEPGTPNNFAIDAFAVCNMPSEGRIPIYNESSSEWIPGSIRDVTPSGYSGLALDSDFHLTYNASYYPGFPATPTIDTHIPQTAGEFNAAGVSVAAGGTIFVYERAVTNDTAPFVLIKARYEESADVTPSSPTYYYRLDITPGEHYVPLYRNFNYRVKISGINIPGYSTPGEAAKRNSGDNFSVSLDTQELSEVSNGVTQIFVKQMEVAALYSADPQDFWYQFLLISDGNYYNGATGTPAAGASTSVTIEEIQTGALDSWSRAGSDDAENKRHITYSLNEPTTEDLTSVLRITGTYTPSGGAAIKLIRDVKFEVLAKKTFTASFSPSTVGPEAGDQTSLDISLPGDLPKGIFPLTFKIEDSAKGLNPTDEDVSVTPGKSIINASDNAYQFIKTLNWSEYEGLIEEAAASGKSNPVLSLKMKTIKDNASTTAYISSPYFNTASTALAVDSDTYISPAHKTVDSSASSYPYKVYSDGNWTLSIGRENGTTIVGTSLSVTNGTATGVGGQDVNVTIPENPSKSDRILVLSLKNTTSGVERKAYITQSGKQFKLTSHRTTVLGNVTSVTVSLKSDYAGTWTITTPAGITATPSSGTGDQDITISGMAINTSTTDDIRNVITANLASEGLESSVTIVQRKGTIASGLTAQFTTTGYSTSDFVNTIDGITATFSSITNAGSYIQIPNNGTLTLSTDSSISAITSIAFVYNVSPNSVSIVSGGGSYSSNTWTGSNKEIQLRFSKTGTSTRITSFTVTYNGLAYE